MSSNFPQNKFANNTKVEMTRRIPNLTQKQIKRDAKIAQRLTFAWDTEKDKQKVFEIFLKERALLSNERYWELLRTVWIVSGTMDNVAIFKQLMKATRGQRFFFSTPEEHKSLRELPTQVKVYRATNDPADQGISWTLNYEYAVQYQQMFCKKIIVDKLVNKAEIFAYIDRNLESEILIL